ncbi:hypothetical protein Nepgr_006688 [Nepenthes gracilis]|uniref:Uncharacterized protein n=1 Tax=Nepenthes gracilis TaxID=150966 RepID=A0AAD3S5G9_NEPGR|nr:hypothetical protein Nepgr_006688 [Nepenthes gracilis]
MIQKSDSGLVDFSDTEISLAAAFPGFCCPDTVIESSAPETMHSCWLVSQCCCQCCGTWLVSSLDQFSLGVLWVFAWLLRSWPSLL